MDIYGCPIEKTYYGNLDLEFEYNMDNKTNNTSKSLYLDYIYNNYLVNIQRSIYTIDSLDYLSDTYLNIGYKFEYNKYTIKTYIGGKIANGAESISNKLDDYILTFDYIYFVKNNFFYDFSMLYTITGDNEIKNKDYVNYSLGLVYIKNKFNYKILYSNSGSNQKLLNIYENIDFTIKYQISKQYYTQIGYSIDIKNSEFSNSYINFGVSFE